MEEKSETEDKSAAIASLRALLKPRSIAVIGASHRQATIGNKLFHNILHQEFRGVVYPVNPNAEAVAAVKTYSSVLDIPGDVDMAVVITRVYPLMLPPTIRARPTSDIALPKPRITADKMAYLPSLNT